MAVTGNLLAGQYLAEHIPGAEFKTVDGSAHMIFWKNRRRRAVRSWSFCDATEVSKSFSFFNETEMALGYRCLYSFLEVRKCRNQRCRSFGSRRVLID